MHTPRTRLRLLLLASSYWPEHSPPQRRWYSLIRHLRERRWAVSVVCPVAHNSAGPDFDRSTQGRAWRKQAGFLGEVIYRVPFLQLGERRLCKLADQVVSALGSIARGVLTGSQDVVVVTAPSLPLLGSALLIARLKRRPLVVEMRDAWPNLAEDASLLRGGSKSLINRAVEYVQNRADVVVTVTEGFAESLRQRGVRHVVTVRNGIMMERTPLLPPPRTPPGAPGGLVPGQPRRVTGPGPIDQGRCAGRPSCASDPGGSWQPETRIATPGPPVASPRGLPATRIP